VANTPSFINIVLANPLDLAFNKGMIIGKKSNKFATLFITGALTSMGKGQVCIVPDIHLWDRCLAVIGKVLGKDKLYVPRWENGVSFRTGFSNDKGGALAGVRVHFSPHL
jgi:hypothetical protein